MYIHVHVHVPHGHTTHVHCTYIHVVVLVVSNMICVGQYDNIVCVHAQA